MTRKPATTRRVLGIDPGTRVVGYGLLDSVRPRETTYVECGVIRLDERESVEQRIWRICGEIDEIIEEFEPHELAVECAFHGLNASSSLKLAEARGAIKLSAMRKGLAVAEYPPAKIKQVVAGNGRATKAEVTHRMSLVCGLQTAPPSDAADALAIALCHVLVARPIVSES